MDPSKTVGFVPRADIEIDFDIENDDIVYMYGLHVSERVDDHTWTDGAYRSFHTYDRSDPTAEGRLLADFWHWLHDTVASAHAAGLTVAVYCYSGGFAEIPRMKEAAARHPQVAGVPSVDDIGALPSNEWWVDMHEIAKQLHWPTRSLGLKVLAPLSGFSWNADDASGANSIIWYRAACDATNPERGVMGEKLLRYNADDVLATRELRQWLHNGVHGRGWRIDPVETLTA